ncbi:MAG: T9SS type A sorting domain-containing protein [Hyphomicrobiales bacterium]
MNYRYKFLLFLLSFLLFPTYIYIYAQDIQHPKVSKKADDVLPLAWIGGLNSCQIFELDLNNDNTQDLIVFDRHGNRILPVLRFKSDDGILYQYHPEYIECFPQIYSWLQLHDYNNDGKKDIFTYSKGWAGIKVYKNTSTENKLSFEIAKTPYISSLQGGGQINILVTDVDYPGIIDLDQDGDLDILTFWGLGSFVELHKNLSVETYGHADSLTFEKINHCWGNFAESDESNDLYLDSCINYNTHPPINRSDYRHTGSTFFLKDLNDDNKIDLLLGDVDYSSLVYLENRNTSIDANMVKQTRNFPSENECINLYSMPCVSEIDIDLDGILDLVVSPFDPSLHVSQNKYSLWAYRNIGTNEKPNYKLYSKSFLQNLSIDVGSGSKPVIYDWNNDGLKDLFICNWGIYNKSWYYYLTLKSSYISRVLYYQNIGTPDNPVFKMVSDDFAKLSQLNEKGITICFADVNKDEKTEMILGSESGKLTLYQNTATIEEPKFSTLYEIAAPSETNKHTKPYLYDIDMDNDLDLLLGRADGQFSLYTNTTDNNFKLSTQSFGQINLTDLQQSYTGNSDISIIEKDGQQYAICGCEKGRIRAFRINTNDFESKFVEVDKLSSIFSYLPDTIKAGVYSTVSAADIDNDLFPELIIGNWSGGLQWFGSANKGIAYDEIQETKPQPKFKVYPNPAKDHITITSYPSKAKSYTIYNSLGIQIKTGHLQPNSTTINTTSLQTGLYAVRINNQTHIIYVL